MHAKPVKSKTESEFANRQSHGATFAKVVNGRKQPVRGLWRRAGLYYAQLTIEDSFTGQKKVCRLSLCNAEGEPVQTVPQAIEEMHRLKVKRAEDDLPKLGRTPGFSTYTDDYLNFIKSGSGMKKPGTVAKEDHTLQKWKRHLREMAKRRASDSQWLFPSPQRGEKDIHVQTFRESLGMATEKASHVASPYGTPTRGDVGTISTFPHQA